MIARDWRIIGGLPFRSREELEAEVAELRTALARQGADLYRTRAKLLQVMIDAATRPVGAPKKADVCKRQKRRRRGKKPTLRDRLRDMAPMIRSIEASQGGEFGIAGWPEEKERA